MKDSIDSLVSRAVARYRTLKPSNMYDESMWQYADMANGGDGGSAGSYNSGEPTIREKYYKNYPDLFFFRVLSELKEYEKYMKAKAENIGIP